ncbi:inositol monophosphatase family protein [Empedobacter sp.]|uniref:inositol monophosphatase family protein n=1 Tax=Empedobacter sp. TaxID=1927715 RepID=UPI00289F68C0|nr:inositol monophosphatase family protein [Empedobacter sp.]
MEQLQMQATEIIKNVARELQEKYVPKEKGVSKERMFELFEIANSFAEHAIRTALNKIVPDIAWADAEFNIVAQQKGMDKDYWVCDALDGAVHFLQGCFPWVISLVLMRNNQPEFSILYYPEKDEQFTAKRGGGAFLNGIKIEVNSRKTLDSAFVSTFHRYGDDGEKELLEKTLLSMKRVIPKTFALRILGPASLQMAYIACGRLEAFWEFGNDIYDWLAGSLLVEEAGGVVTDTVGNAFGIKSNLGILSTNNTIIRDELIRIF